MTVFSAGHVTPSTVGIQDEATGNGPVVGVALGAELGTALGEADVLGAGVAGDERSG